ncbi:50S ribosomal protein L19 [Smittium culicis]|uniref:50S ribosomal protein L19 n=1 Tax=Smittium culicis TaxID=133412 RepID=A0A1R1XY87_9FUNG|nr:50S ribosomal protein L19 [Smittium culicis]
MNVLRSGLVNGLFKRTQTPLSRFFQTTGIRSDILKSVIIPKPEFPVPLKHPKEKKISIMNTIKRESLNRLDHDNRSLLFKRRAPVAQRMSPGDAVLVESSNNLTNPEFTTQFIGIVIAINRRGLDTSFTLRNVILKVGVEMKFKAFSPLVRKITVLRKGRGFRRAKLYYLRDRAGSIIKAKAAKKLSEAYNSQNISL